MKIFLLSVVAAIGIAGLAAVVLNSLEMSSTAIYSSDATRR